jgi:hypothetical protein
VKIPPILALGQRTASRCPEPSPTSSHGFWLSALFAILVVAVLLFVPAAQAAPIQSISWDFAASNGGWTQFNTAAFTPVPITPKWTWSGGTWTVDSAPVDSPASKFGNYLTSPLIQLGELPADKFTLNLAHRFKLPTDGLVLANGAQLPVDAGQFEYSLDGATFLPVFKTDWKASGPISPILTPYVQSASWAVPQFVPGVAPFPSLFPLIDGGASFTGSSDGFSSGWFVGSQAFEVDFPGATQTIQFRFTNMNLGPKCGLDAGWDIRFAQVDLVLAPEPSGFAIVTVGGAMAVSAYILRRRSGRARSTSVPRDQA